MAVRGHLVVKVCDMRHAKTLGAFLLWECQHCLAENGEPVDIDSPFRVAIRLERG